jgi:ABC-2 type transport system permease protein
MIRDIWTVMGKEWREYLAGASTSGGSGRGRGVIGVLLVVGIVSILLPLLLGRTLITSGVPIIVDGLYLPFIILVNLIADSFAGERERHTLETLLASRLSDRSILLGKVGAGVAYGTGIGLIASLVQAVVANVSPKNAGADSGFAFYSVGLLFVIIVMGLLVSLLTSSAGCLISLRAATTRQAQVNLGVGFLVLLFVPVIVFQLLPGQWQSAIVAQLNAAGPTRILLDFEGALFVVSVLLLLVSLALFRRSRLILT